MQVDRFWMIRLESLHLPKKRQCGVGREDFLAGKSLIRSLCRPRCQKAGTNWHMKYPAQRELSLSPFLLCFPTHAVLFVPLFPSVAPSLHCNSNTAMLRQALTHATKAAARTAVKQPLRCISPVTQNVIHTLHSVTQKTPRYACYAP